MSGKIKVTIKDREGKVQCVLWHDTDKTLLETLREGAVPLPSLCGAAGKCGRCMVKFCSHAPLPARTDRSVIAPDKLREGYRLACTARPKRECTVETDFAGRKAAEEGKLQVVAGYDTGGRPRQEEGSTDEKRAEGGSICGRTFAAADIGTTTIAMQLVDSYSGSILDTYTCLNPQRSYGTDVIARIRAAGEGRGEKLKGLVRSALSSGVEQLRHTAGRRGVEGPGLLCIACNTAMGHIFMGYPADTLGKSPFLPVKTGMDTVKWDGMDVVLLPGVSAFIGGDIVAGLYACGLLPLGPADKKYADPDRKEAESEERGSGAKDGGSWLFIDLGTNAEMVMGAGRRMAATAAAAGPAFEGRGTDGAAGPERIYAIAKLLERGLVDETGLLAEPYFETGADVEIAGYGDGAGTRIIHVTQEDIRAVQMAKAAVRAGIHFLTKRLGIADCGRIEKVYIAGGMGFYLDRDAAARIGLLPADLARRAQTAGNTALAGACLFGRESRPEDKRAGMEGWRERGMELERAAAGIEVFQMAELAEFSDIYIGYMNFDCNIAPEMV